MSAGESLIRAVESYRRWRRERQPGALGAFHRAGADAALLRLLPLHTDDRVIDAGGFQGDFTASVLVRFGCRSLILEPLPDAVRLLRDRFERNSRVELIEAALGAADGEAQLSVAGNSSSLVAGGGGASIRVPVLGVESLFKRLGDAPTGCLKLNIEGAEFEVLDKLLEVGLQRRVRSLFIQFHQVAPDSAERRDRLRARLAETHREVVSYEFVWELWVAREP